MKPTRVKMPNTNLWLSYMQERYVAKLENARRILKWTGKKETWDCDNCMFSAVGMSNDLVLIVARRTKFFFSSYMKKSVQVNLMIGFKVKQVDEPIEEEYCKPSSHNVEDKNTDRKRLRWVIHLKQVDEEYDPSKRPISECCIWQWAEDDKKKTIKESKLYRLYTEIIANKDNPVKQKNIFQIKTEKQDEIIPVFYQPRIDAWKNFVREIHTHKVDDNEIEVTIIFNDEQLRKHSILDPIYRIFRRFRYKRIKDIESFRILVENIPKSYTFESIYSGKHTLYADSIHEDKPDKKRNVPHHKIKYYFSSTLHPIVFVNTSNHALAEHDNNHFHWKWEYAAWEKESPVVFGNKSRKNIDNEFRRVKVN